MGYLVVMETYVTFFLAMYYFLQGTYSVTFGVCI